MGILNLAELQLAALDFHLKLFCSKQFIKFQTLCSLIHKLQGLECFQSKSMSKAQLQVISQKWSAIKAFKNLILTVFSFQSKVWKSF